MAPLLLANKVGPARSGTCPPPRKLVVYSPFLSRLFSLVTNTFRRFACGECYSRKFLLFEWVTSELLESGGPRWVAVRCTHALPACMAPRAPGTANRIDHRITNYGAGASVIFRSGGISIVLQCQTNWAYFIFSKCREFGSEYMYQEVIQK